MITWLRRPALAAKLTPHVVAGKMQHRSHVLERLETAIYRLNLFFTGGNNGNLIVKL